MIYSELKVKKEELKKLEREQRELLLKKELLEEEILSNQIECMNNCFESKYELFIEQSYKVFRSEQDSEYRKREMSSGIDFGSFLGGQYSTFGFIPENCEWIEKVFSEIFKDEKIKVTLGKYYRYDRINDEVIPYTQKGWKQKRRQGDFKLLRNLILSYNNEQLEGEEVKDDGVIDLTCDYWFFSITEFYDIEKDELLIEDSISFIKNKLNQYKIIHLNHAELCKIDKKVGIKLFCCLHERIKENNYLEI
jgi:hypothetical protein